MAEQTLDSYIVQLNFFKNMCKNPLTTRNDIELEWNNLLTLDDLIEDELSTMLLPPQTFSHFQKFVAVEVQRSRKCDIHASFVNLINLRKENEPNITPQDDALEYIKETENIKQLMMEVVNSCEALKERHLIMNSH